MQPTDDERVLAALAHVGVLANIMSLAGVFGAALIWGTQRDKSAYVRGQALQAMVYQIAAIFIGLLLALSWGMCLGVALLPALLRPELYETSRPALFWPAMLTGIVPLGFLMLAVLYGLYGAVQAYHGRPFRYAVVGRLVAAPVGAAAAPAAPPVPGAAAPVDSAAPAAAESAEAVVAPSEELAEAEPVREEP